MAGAWRPDRCGDATGACGAPGVLTIHSREKAARCLAWDSHLPSSMMRSFILVIGVASVPVGCGTFVTTTPLNEAPRTLAPRAATSVGVFSSEAPSRPHVDLALLEATQNDGQGTAAMVDSLRARAGAMGCDAIFIGNASSREHYASGYGLIGSSTFVATCIVYTDGANPAPPVVEAPREGRRRMCVDRADFDRNRNCVLPRGAL
jgi:hypothetical protein